MGSYGRARAADAPNPVCGGTAARPIGQHIARCGLPSPPVTSQMTATGHEPWRWCCRSGCRRCLRALAHAHARA
eukprot:156346-Chlamydomonas_euryale.AAC.9